MEQAAHHYPSEAEVRKAFLIIGNRLPRKKKKQLKKYNKKFGPTYFQLPAIRFSFTEAFPEELKPTL